MRGFPNTEHDLWTSLSYNLVSGCWEYTKSLDKDGYGRFFWKQKYLPAHRAAWLFTFGVIPDGIEVCHSCDNPKCCNPNHLWLGTTADNQKDCTRKGRGRIGTRNGRAVVNNEDVLKIRELLDSGVGGSEIARKFGVSPTLISRINLRRSWNHI